MSNAKIRFEVRLAEGFKSIWGIFDHKNGRFVKKEDGFNVACRTANQETGARIAEQLNGIHEAQEKLRREQEFEASAPKTAAKKPATKKATPKAATKAAPKAPEPKAETKPAPMKRTPPKVVKTKTTVEFTPAPVTATKPRRKKAA